MTGHDLTRPLPVRYARVVGVRAVARTYWDDEAPCTGETGFHETMGREIWRSGDPDDSSVPAQRTFPQEAWEGHCCDRCGRPAPEGANRQVFTLRVWDTPSGALEPGCLYHPTWLPDDVDSAHYRNPDGSLRLHAVLPCGCHWVIDGRASNCTRPGDDTHRCWVRHGDPEDPQGQRGGRKFHVDKQGDTCAAGAGSIVCAGRHYHGFLHDGAFTPNL